MLGTLAEDTDTVELYLYLAKKLIILVADFFNFKLVLCLIYGLLLSISEIDPLLWLESSFSSMKS